MPPNRNSHYLSIAFIQYQNPIKIRTIVHSRKMKNVIFIPTDSYHVQESREDLLFRL